jgi:hypothetical protein
MSRTQALEAVKSREASVGDVPKQGSDPQRDLRDDGIIAQVLAIIYAECDRAKIASNLAKEEGRKADMYRHNTALHALWEVAGKISAIKGTPVK